MILKKPCQFITEICETRIWAAQNRFHGDESIVWRGHPDIQNPVGEC